MGGRCRTAREHRGALIVAQRAPEVRCRIGAVSQLTDRGPRTEPWSGAVVVALASAVVCHMCGIKCERSVGTVRGPAIRRASEAPRHTRPASSIGRESPWGQARSGGRAPSTLRTRGRPRGASCLITRCVGEVWGSGQSQRLKFTLGPPLAWTSSSTAQTQPEEIRLLWLCFLTRHVARAGSNLVRSLE